MSRRVDVRRSGPPLPLALLTLALLHAHGASAQGTGLDGPLTLKRTPQLAETIPPLLRSQLPSLVSGDRISGRPDLETVVEGNASLRRGETIQVGAASYRVQHDPWVSADGVLCRVPLSGPIVAPPPVTPWETLTTVGGLSLTTVGGDEIAILPRA